VSAPVYRTARKLHKCANGNIALRGVNQSVTAMCRIWIEKGDRYREGDIDLDYAGGFGHDRICTGCEPESGAA